MALNTRALSDEETAAAIADAERVTGLPAADPVKGGAEKLVRAVTEALGVTPAGARAS